jgi:hypothetical protein
MFFYQATVNFILGGTTHTFTHTIWKWNSVCHANINNNNNIKDFFNYADQKS